MSLCVWGAQATTLLCTEPLKWPQLHHRTFRKDLRKNLSLERAGRHWSRELGVSQKCVDEAHEDTLGLSMVVLVHVGLSDPGGFVQPE